MRGSCIDFAARYGKLRALSMGRAMQVSIANIVEAFPDYRVAVVVAEDLTIAAERPAALDALIATREAAARERWGGMELAQIPGIAAWRAAYKGFGIKQTRYRSSVERLVKNVLAGRPLARVNTFVDLYNAVSLEHVLPLGADDLGCVTPPLAFRFARDGDSFLDMADTAAGEPPEAPKAGEVVYADADHVLCRRWNWRQDARSLITPATTRAVVTMQANGAGDPVQAADDLIDLIGQLCFGRTRVAILDKTQPTATLAAPLSLA
jgi:DNA/RNA-binding domain of Phe-tRNA-synthetase-like protein